MGHPEVDAEHLLRRRSTRPMAWSPPDGRHRRDVAGLRAGVEQDLAKRPRVSGPGAAPGQVMVTQRLSLLLDTAEHEEPH